MWRSPGCRGESAGSACGQPCRSPPRRGAADQRRRRVHRLWTKECGWLMTRHRVSTTAARSPPCAASRSCSSGLARTPTRSRPSGVRRPRSCRCRTTRWPGRSRQGTLTDLPGIGASSAKVIAAAVRGELPERLADLEARARRPAHQRWRRAARRAAWRPALALRLERRRLADRGDGDDGHRARSRLPRAHRPLAAAQGRPRVVGRAAAAPARRGRGGQRAPGRAAPASRCSRASRSTSSTTARSTRPTRCSTGSTSASPACTPSWRWTRPDDAADDRRRSATRAPTCSATAPVGW